LREARQQLPGKMRAAVESASHGRRADAGNTAVHNDFVCGTNIATPLATLRTGFAPDSKRTCSMGMFGSMLTAVAGLRAQSFALENISGNIANSSTPGFKRVDTSFTDLIPEGPLNRQVSGSVNAFSRLTNTIEGDFLATSIPTNIALNGEGFFVVRPRPNEDAIISGQSAMLFTRRGDFEVDRLGYLVNGAGYALQGQTLDRETGQPINANNGFIRIDRDPLPAQASRNITYNGVLPRIPATVNYNPDNPGSELLGPPASYPNSPASLATIHANDVDTFTRSTLPGGSVSIYNATGAVEPVNLRWAKTGADTWSLYYQDGSTDDTAWVRIGGDIIFNPDGSLQNPALSLTSADPAFVNGTEFQQFTINFGGRLTQFSSDTRVQPTLIDQDGYSVGRFSSVGVSDNGVVSIAYSNGQVVPVAIIDVVRFPAPNMLKRADGGAFEQTLESGAPIIGLDNGTIMSGTIEGSNTDISEEFAKMIVTQQAYSANTRVISTSQEMIREVLNIVR
jgi:flagellar hook protein FlgE